MTRPRRSSPDADRKMTRDEKWEVLLEEFEAWKVEQDALPPWVPCSQCGQMFREGAEHECAGEEAPGPADVSAG